MPDEFELLEAACNQPRSKRISQEANMEAPYASHKQEQVFFKIGRELDPNL
jgi:hypothetical protein